MLMTAKQVMFLLPPTCWFDVALPQIQHKREGTQGPQNYVIKDQNKEEVLAWHVK